MRHLKFRIPRFALPLAFLFLISAGCERIRPEEGGITPSPAVTVSQTTPVPEATTEVPNPPAITMPVAPLRIWLPPEVGARTEAGAQELDSQIRAYQTSHPTLEIIVEQKPMDGPGGLLDFLQTGRDVAPSIMPDLVAVPTSLLADTRLRDLFYPLNGLLDGEFINDIYPAPAGQVTREEQLLGYPFATSGLTHLIYDPAVITETIPMSWTRLISDTDHTMVIPADSREGAMLGLQFYLAQGGRLVDEAGRATLDAEPLAEALAMIGLRKANLLQSHQLKTLDEAWQYHQLGLSDFMWTRADYLLGRQVIDPTLSTAQGYTAVPGPAVALIPLTTSWAWALTTDDPARQELAADLILSLTAPGNLANWSDRSLILPAQRSAMRLLAEENAYYQFAGVESERARAMPLSETSRLMDVLGDAVFQVLTTDISPVIIAEQAATAFRQ